MVSTTLPATAVLLEQAAVSVDHDGLIDTRWSDAVSDDSLKNCTRCRYGRPLRALGVSAERHRVDRHDRIDRVSAGGLSICSTLFGSVIIPSGFG